MQVLSFSTLIQDGATFVVNGEGEKIGRIVVACNQFHARHLCQHEGGYFKRMEDAVKHIVGHDLLIDASFAGRLEVAA